MSDALELATRALKHFNEGTTDRAPSQMRIPVSAYTDEAQFQAERQAVFLNPPSRLHCLSKFQNRATFSRKPSWASHYS